MPVDRREVIARAAVSVLAAGGARSLTHRAVDAAAGLADGSTSNVFRTRAALIGGVLTFLGEHERAALDAIATGSGPLSAAALTRIAAAVIDNAVTVGRETTLARRALFQEASTDPDVAAQLLDATRQWWAVTADLLRRCGAPDPDHDARRLLAYVDGVIADQLARPEPGFDAAAAIGPAVRGVLTR